MNYRDLLNANDILQLLTKQLNLAPKQMGKSIFFLCPFHDDKNPSLSFEPHRKIFTCFSCGFKAKDVFDFWAQYQKISSEEALTEISKLGFAAKISSFLTQRNKILEPENKNKTSFLFSLLVNIYQHNLLTPAGKGVLNYLQNKRQVNRNLMERFSLGCSINSRQISNLLFHQKNDNFSDQELLSTNMIRVTDDNQVYDFFSEPQLIIPLANSEGKIMALAGRKINEENGNGKYKYLPNYPGYHKSSLLYNYVVAKKNRSEECYLVEGFFDVISLTKLGKENCVAILGTSLSEEQVKLLVELKKRVVFFLDGDQAGREATVNLAIKLLLREVDCEIIKPNYQSDPDEICRSWDKETVDDLLSQRENPFLFIINHYFSQWEVQENPQRVSRFVNEMARLFQKFKINIKNFVMEKISLLTNLNREEIEPYFSPPNLFASDSLNPQTKYYQELIQEQEKKIIYLCAKRRIFWLFTSQKKYFFESQTNRDDYRNIYNYYLSSPNKNSFDEYKVLLKSYPLFFPNGFEKGQSDEEQITEEQLLKSAPHEQTKVIELIFQEIDSIRKKM